MRIIYSDDPVQFGYSPASFLHRGRLGCVMQPDRIHSYEERIGWLHQGQSLGHGENAVEHVKLEGDIIPSLGSIPTVVESGIEIFYGPGSYRWQVDATTEGHLEVIETSYGLAAFSLTWSSRKTEVYSPSVLTQVWRTKDKLFTHGRLDTPREDHPIEWFLSWIRRYLYTSWRSGWSGSPRTFSMKIPKPDVGRIRSFCWNLLKWHAVKLDPSWDRTLYRRLLEGQKDFNGNMINFVSKVGSIGTSLRADLNLLLNVTDPKAWAGAWLANRFSDRLLARNVKQIADGFLKDIREFKLGYQVSRSRINPSVEPVYPMFENSSCQISGKLICSNDSATQLMSMVKKLYEWDAYPTLENAWDLVPFSFVVDWFANIGTILENIDTMVYNQYLRAELFEVSEKILMDISPKHFQIATGTTISPGQLHLSSYRRGAASIPDLGILDDWAPSLPSQTNVFDLTALAVQVLL